MTAGFVVGDQHQVVGQRHLAAVAHDLGWWSADAFLTFACKRNDVTRLNAGTGDAFDSDYDRNDLSARFVGGSTDFSVAVAGDDCGSVFYGAGLAALVNDRTAFNLGYFGETSDDDQIDTLRLTVRLSF